MKANGNKEIVEFANKYMEKYALFLKSNPIQQNSPIKKVTIEMPEFQKFEKSGSDSFLE